MSSLYSELERNFLQFKDQFVFQDRLTYGQLLEEVNQYKIDLTPSSVFLAELTSGPEFVKTLLVALKARLVFSPIAVDSGDFDRAEKILKPNAILKQNYQFIHSKINPNLVRLCPDGGFVRFTSGTTGNSKGVLISSQSAAERIKAAERSFRLKSDDKVLFLMSMPYHFVTSLLMMLKNGVCFTEEPAQASVIYATPFHYQNLQQEILPNLRLAISTSTHLPENVSEEFISKYKIPISQSYGIIEVGLPIGDFENTSSESVGKALDGYEVKFFDGDANSGIIAIKGPGLFDAYLEPFKERHELLRDGWFVTGDYAKRDSKGSIFIKGRNTSAIHLAGFKVFPEEIEDVLMQHPKIIEAQVSSEPHEIYGNTILAKLVCAEVIDIKELRSFCKKKLGIIKTPKRFEFVEALAKTSTGKLLRKDIKEVSIIGAGLAGCTVGTLLQRAGFDVTIYDYGKRPDLVVGESLIPALIPIIQRLGLEDEVKSYSMKKPGATIYLEPEIEWQMSFSNYGSVHYAYNVPRKNFDQSFKELALKSGCKFKQELAGKELLKSENFVIDASGRRRFIANELELDYQVGKRKDLALFAHFEGVEIKHPGNLHMNVTSEGWFWRIPLVDKVSVGVVISPEALAKYGKSAEAQFDNITAEVIGQHLAGAKRITQVMKYQNYQLMNEKMFGPNWACVGDAAGFADPVFSSGVFLALSGAVFLADHIIENGFSDFTAYENFVKSELRSWKEIIESFYDGRFLSMIRYGSAVDESKFTEIKSLVAQVMGGFADKRALAMFFNTINYCHQSQLCSNF